MAPKKLLGPKERQAPRLDADLTERSGDDLDDEELLEDVAWTGGSPASATGVELVRCRLTGVSLTGLELVDLRLVDVVLEECELSGTQLTNAEWERVVLRRCRMSGVVAPELRATDVRLEGCKADQAWLRSAVLDRWEVVDTDFSGSDLASATVTRSAFRRSDLTEVDVSQSRFDGVSLHGSTVDRLKGADALRGCTISSDQLVPLALPILAAKGIKIDDDPPDLTEP